MKQLLYTSIHYILIVCILLWITPRLWQASETEYFTVTAYYSPLPNQEYYLTGDYELEKRLNGEGIAWASGKKVFSGMLAGPAKYPFGTKIELEWVGIWVIEDRGGAIVSAWERGYSHDRIDMWVWYGDEWLRRALYWGKRTIRGKIVDKNSQVRLDIQGLPAPHWVTTNIASQRNTPWVMFPSSQNAQATHTVSHNTVAMGSPQIPTLFQTGMGRGASWESVEKLQDILVTLWYLNESAKSWIYDNETIAAIFRLQREYEILQESTDVWAGYFWPSTRKKLRELYGAHLEKLEEEKHYHAMIDNLLEDARNQASTEIEALWNPQLWDISPNVRVLQILLRELGYFNTRDTAIFWPVTRDAIIAFQMSQGVIESENNRGAWIFWPKTRDAMIEELTRIYFQRILEEHEIYEEFIIRKQNSLQVS